MGSSFYGFYRSKVINNRDPNHCGRVAVWIPDTMINIPETQGIWAGPANNPIGGRNTEGGMDNRYMGTSFIPAVGSWMWIFFEAGDPTRPFYFAACELENTFALPEVYSSGLIQAKWVVFKSHEGRTIVVSDDPDDARMEITGKKRHLAMTDPAEEDASGGTNSVYQIENNQTTILIDEREDSEKILIKTYMGDYINIDVASRQMQTHFMNDIKFESTMGNIILHAPKGEVKIVGMNATVQGYAGVVIYAVLSIDEQTIGTISRKAAVINDDATGKHTIHTTGPFIVNSDTSATLKATLSTTIESDTSIGLISNGNVGILANTTIDLLSTVVNLQPTVGAIPVSQKISADTVSYMFPTILLTLPTEGERDRGF